MSILEVRGNKKVCQTQCGQHLCYKGTAQASGCPMFSYPASIAVSTECMMCLNCLKSCDNRGVQINLRPPLQELWRQTQPVLSLSLFGVILVGLMARHQFPKLTFWLNIESSLGWSEVFTHTVVYSFFVLAALIPFALGSTLSAAASQEKVSENMAHYGMAFIPLALAGHLAHVAHEWLRNGVYDFLKYLIKVYEWLTAGIPIGSREVVMDPFIHNSIVTFLKFMMVTGGMLGSLIALIMIARRMSEKNVFARIMPHLLILLFFYAGYLFIYTGSTGAAAPAPATPAAATPAPVKAGVPVAPAPPPPAAALQWQLLVPQIHNATAVGLNDPAVISWFHSAQLEAGTGKNRLVLEGQVLGAPPGSRIRVVQDTGTRQPQFESPLDPKGFFNGYLFLNGLNQKIALILEVFDPSGKLLDAHRINLS
jgi:hypothetical protein